MAMLVMSDYVEKDRHHQGRGNDAAGDTADDNNDADDDDDNDDLKEIKMPCHIVFLTVV